MENPTPEQPTPTSADEPAVTREPVVQSGSYRPAEYYSTPPAEKKGCPKALVVGCGALGCLGLILIVAVGAYFVSRPGKLVDFITGQLERELDQIATDDVTSEEKATLRSELRTLRANVQSGAVDIVAVQPLFQKINTSIRDRKLTRDEVVDLIERLQAINKTARRSAPRSTVSIGTTPPLPSS